MLESSEGIMLPWGGSRPLPCPLPQEDTGVLPSRGCHAQGAILEVGDVASLAGA